MGMLAATGRAICLLGIGFGLGFSINAFHPRGVHLRSYAAPVACTAAPGGSTAQAGAAALPPVEVLSLAQVASLCGDPRVLVADARSAAAFAEGHVTGAIHLPCASSRLTANAALDALAGKETLVVYGEGTADALPVAEEMRRRADRPGGVRVAVLAGGFSAWSRAGQACSSGPCADCSAVSVHR